MMSIKVNAKKCKPKQLRQKVKERANAHKYIYTYTGGKLFFKKIELQGGYSLSTSCPSTKHLDSLKGERSTSGCRQAN